MHVVKLQPRSSLGKAPHLVHKMWDFSYLIIIVTLHAVRICVEVQQQCKVIALKFYNGWFTCELKKLLKLSVPTVSVKLLIAACIQQ